MSPEPPSREGPRGGEPGREGLSREGLSREGPGREPVAALAGGPPGPVEPGPVEPGPVELGLFELGPFQPGSVEPGPVETLAEDHRWEAVGLDRLAQAAAGATLRRLGLDPSGFEVSLLACSDARIGELNADFRGKPQPTNVLSWPSAERAPARAGARPRLPPGNPSDPVPLGDVALAFETCAREAAEAGVPLAAHATHLLVHGVLHLLGYDHERDADAELMEGLEGLILRDLGHPDPYAPVPDASPDRP